MRNDITKETKFLINFFIYGLPTCAVLIIVMFILLLAYRIQSKPITPEQTFKSGYEYSKFYSNADEAWQQYCKNKYIGG